MHKPDLAALRILLLAGVVAVLTPATTARPEAAPNPGRVVVLELFTSQGCSSCPAAEHVLSQIGLREETRQRVVPLAFHVDYWNGGGWRDPFSDREWSARQNAYSRAFRLDGAYTPQLVVNGRAQLIGSDGQRALLEIATDLRHPPAATVALTVRPRDREAVANRGQEHGKAALAVGVTAEVNEAVQAQKLDALVALFESGLVTPIEGGENRGRKLQNDFVVRRLKVAFSLPAKPGSRMERTVTLKLDSGWNLENVGVAAFLQDPATLKIYGATALPKLP